MALRKYISEVLNEINEDPKKLDEYKKDKSMDLFFKYAFDPKGKFILPDGIPPYRPDAAPLGMSPAVFWQEVNRFYVFCRTDIKAIKREQLFISMLESVHPDEAKIMIAVKDQTVTKLYKKITKKLIESAGIIPADDAGN
jgi:hypothetical protein